MHRISICCGVIETKLNTLRQIFFRKVIKVSKLKDDSILYTIYSSILYIIYRIL